MSRVITQGYANAGYADLGYTDHGYSGIITQGYGAPPPVYDFSVSYQSGLPVYGLIFVPSNGTAWNGSAFVDPFGAAWPTCAIPMVDDGSGSYSGNVPSAVPSGNYLVQAYLQLGDAPADTDPLVGTGTIFWPGPVVPPPGGNFEVPYATGQTLYGLIGVASGLCWNGSAFVLPTGGNRAACVVPMTEGPTGIYRGNAPPSLPVGTYTVQAYLRLGAIPADNDPIVGKGTIFWAGPGGPTTLTFRQALVASLKANPALTTIIGQRVYPQVLPQSAKLPAMTYAVVTNVPLHNLSGAAGITAARCEFKAYSAIDADCGTIIEAVRNQFDGFNAGLPGAVEVVETLKKLEYDHWDPPASQSGYGTYMKMNDFLFRYRESIPTL